MKEVLDVNALISTQVIDSSFLEDALFDPENYLLTLEKVTKEVTSFAELFEFIN